MEYRPSWRWRPIIAQGKTGRGTPMGQTGSPRCGGQEQSGWLRTRRGFSQFKFVVAIGVLGIGLIVLAGSATGAIREPAAVRTEVEYWAALQTVGDSLQQRDSGALTDGNRTVGDFSFNWTVDNSTTNLVKVTLAASYTGSRRLTDTVLTDTVMIYVVKAAR